MKTHFLLRFMLPLLALLASPANADYPEGFPRIGPVTQIAIDNTHFARALKLVRNTTDNEYLTVWEAPANVLNGLRLDGNTLQPVNGATPFVILDARGENPHHPGSTFNALVSYDVTWDPDRQRYFIAAYLPSTREDSSGSSYATYAGYLPVEPGSVEVADLSSMPVCELQTSGNGLRAVHYPSGLMYVFRTFGRDRPLPSVLLSDDPVPASGVCAQRINGVAGSAAASYLGGPATVARLTEMLPANDLTAFYVSDLAVEYDPEFNHFLLATVIAEGDVQTSVDGGVYTMRFRSDVVTRIVTPSLPSSGATTFHKVSSQNTVSQSLTDDPHNGGGPESWSAYNPQLIPGPLSDDGTSRSWLVTFTGVNPGEANDLGQSRPRVSELWSHALTASASNILTVRPGLDRMLSHNSAPSSNTSSHPSINGSIWLPEVGRYLTMWGSCNVNCTIFGNSLKSTGGFNAAVRDIPIGAEIGDYDRAHLVRSIDEESLFSVLVEENRFSVQKLDLRWLDLSVSTQVLGNTTIPAGEEVTVQIAAIRADDLDGPADGNGGLLPVVKVDSGAYRLHLTLPEHLTLVEVDDLLTGNIEEGFTGIETDIELEPGDVKSFRFKVRNDSPLTDATAGDIHVAIESAPDRIEHDASNDTSVVSVTLAGTPEDTNPDDGNDDGDNTNPGDDDGNDDTNPGDDDDDDGTNPGDGSGDGNGDDDDDDTGSLPPGNDDDDAGGSGGGGGGALGWLLLGLAGFSVRRRLLN